MIKFSSSRMAPKTNVTMEIAETVETLVTLATVIPATVILATVILATVIQAKLLFTVTPR